MKAMTKGRRNDAGQHCVSSNASTPPRGKERLHFWIFETSASKNKLCKSMQVNTSQCNSMQCCASQCNLTRNNATMHYKCLNVFIVASLIFHAEFKFISPKFKVFCSFYDWKWHLNWNKVHLKLFLTKIVE